MLVATTYSKTITGPFNDTIIGSGAINAGCLLRRAWLPDVKR